jgi:hypothetical protein
MLLRRKLLLLPLLLCGCAGFDQERHVAPLFTELSLAGGEREIEALGGSLLLRRDPESGDTRYWALRPFLSDEVLPEGERFGWFLPPFGTYRRKATEDVFQFLPLIRFAQQYPVAARSTWSFLALPGIYWAKTNDGRVVRAWFPFGGVVERFLSFDRAEFVLFPLWARTERAGRVAQHVLWPIFCFTSGAGGTAWRIWPLLGVDRYEGRYERWFALWPVFLWQDNDLDTPTPQHSWMVWPIYGRSTRGDSISWTTLWPFFGYTKNESKGFWGWDGPWPLVVFQQPGTSGQAVRERVWPFYSRYEGDGLTSRYALWPFYNVRHEEYPRVTKDTTYIFPFWHAWDKESEESGHSEWRKLFPVYRTYSSEHPSEDFYAFPALNPFYRLRFVDEHYAWMWELYGERRVDDRIQQRSWLGMWRREKDRDEDRRSLSMLWARRDYSQAGERVSESSLLLGLIRWRNGPDGFGLLRPAFPGPGWPLRRTPTTLLQEEGQ